MTFGYRKVWAFLRNEGIHLNPKPVYRIMEDEYPSLEPHIHKNRKGRKNLFQSNGPDELWETDLTYIPTINDDMTYLFNMKDCFTKEWQGYNFSRSCWASDAVRAVEDSVLRAFDGEVPDGLILMTDNGPQYISKQFRKAMNILGIKSEYIQKHTPEDNGIQYISFSSRMCTYLRHPQIF
ncbi:MAG: DDE-type integrase/transposase/recombinase [Thermoplasmatales archaeon]